VRRIGIAIEKTQLGGLGDQNFYVQLAMGKRGIEGAAQRVDLRGVPRVANWSRSFQCIAAR